jgi:hypothetical protein
MGIAAIAGALVPFISWALIKLCGPQAFAWQYASFVLTLVYPFARIPERSDLYAVFVLSVILNATYAAFVALAFRMIFARVSSRTIQVALAVLTVIVTSAVLHATFEVIMSLSSGSVTVGRQSLPSVRPARVNLACVE